MANRTTIGLLRTMFAALIHGLELVLRIRRLQLLQPKKERPLRLTLFHRKTVLQLLVIQYFGQPACEMCCKLEVCDLLWTEERHALSHLCGEIPMTLAERHAKDHDRASPDGNCHDFRCLANLHRDSSFHGCRESCPKNKMYKCQNTILEFECTYKNSPMRTCPGKINNENLPAAAFEAPFGTSRWWTTSSSVDSTARRTPIRRFNAPCIHFFIAIILQKQYTILQMRLQL